MCMMRCVVVFEPVLLFVHNHSAPPTTPRRRRPLFVLFSSWSSRDRK